MVDGFTETQIIGALVALLVASYAAFFGWLVTSIHGLRGEVRETRIELTARIDAVDGKLTARIDAIDGKLTARIDAVDAKFTAKIDGLAIAVSRLEGAVYHGLPEPRRAATE